MKIRKPIPTRKRGRFWTYGRDSVEYSERAIKELKKLDRHTRQMIYAWIGVGCENPREHGKSLTASRSGRQRYRIGKCRLICEIKDNEPVILALSVGRRREIYKWK